MSPATYRRSLHRWTPTTWLRTCEQSTSSFRTMCCLADTTVSSKVWSYISKINTSVGATCGGWVSLGKGAFPRCSSANVKCLRLPVVQKMHISRTRNQILRLHHRRSEINLSSKEEGELFSSVSIALYASWWLMTISRMQVASAYFTARTKTIFRSASAKVSPIVGLSR